MKITKGLYLEERIYAKDDKAAILINEKNAARINSVLDQVQKRSKVRTIDICDVYNYVEKFFKTVTVQKSVLDDVRVTVNPNAQAFPNAYKYTPSATVFTVLFKNGKMYLYDVQRDTCGAHVFNFWFPSEKVRQMVVQNSFDNRVVCNKSYQKEFDEQKIKESLKGASN